MWLSNCPDHIRYYLTIVYKYSEVRGWLKSDHPSKRDGSMLHGPQLTDWLIIFLWCPRIRFYFKAKTVQKHLLVGGFNHLEKYDIVNGKDYPIYYGKKTCSKPPTRKLGYLDVQSLGFSCDMKLVILASAVLPCWKKWNWYWKWQQIRLPKRAKEIGIKVRGPGKISQTCSAATKWHLNIRSKFWLFEPRNICWHIPITLPIGDDPIL